MRRMISLVLMVALIGAVVPVVGAAEEELFDTKAATASLEKGLAMVKAKKYDAAVEVFEDAAATSPDIEAEALYYAGYACYMKSKSGDEDARQRSMEFYDRAYEINPNFSPNKFKPTEPLPGPAAQQGGAVTPAAAAPANTLAVPPAAPPAAPAAPAAPTAPAAPAAPAQQPK
jgi:tetratricopeptide (TPR) repeat protein